MAKYPGAGCAFVVMGIIAFVTLGSLMGWSDGGNLVAFIIAPVAGFLAEWFFASLYSEKPAKVQEAEKKETERRMEHVLYAVTPEIVYQGGHHSYSSSRKGKLGLTDTNLVFFVDTKTDVEGWTVPVREFLFTVPVAQIQAVAWDKTEKLTLGRFLILGPLSLFAKKNNFYLVVNYKTAKGIENTMVFDTDATQQLNFVNRVNVARNKAV